MDVTKIKVVAMDLDGTLTQHKLPLTPAVREALTALCLLIWHPGPMTNGMRWSSFAKRTA